MKRALEVKWEDPMGLAEKARAQTNLVRAVTRDTGKLRAMGKVVHLGKRVATAEARLEDPSGRLYAHASSTCIVL